MKWPLPRMRSPSLFWRTFLLIVALAVASLLAWLPSVRVFEREPRAHQLADQVVSMVHATRSALVYSDPERRHDLLADLFENESLRVVPLEPSDLVEPMVESALLRLVENEVQQRLGGSTRLASKVNGVSGFWVSFAIDTDAYWVFIDRDLLRRDLGHGWIVWGALATVFSLLAAIAIARVVNRPLAQLSRAASELGAGRMPPPLPEAGPLEIRMVNQSFNRMAADLEKLNEDRAILLAGVSHDLRTPLTRLRLEMEMNDIPDANREAMVGDLEQMDQIVSQFLDYAVPGPRRGAEDVDLSQLVHEALARNRLPVASVEPGLVLRGHRTELARMLDNLLANAQRYGRSADGQLELEVDLRRGTGGDAAVLVVADRGPGIPAADVSRLVRPFERGDTSRSGPAGAGLGLAIVERVARLHGARLSLVSGAPSGLRVELRFPAPLPAGGGASAPSSKRAA
jgi:two-component system osmolarity sensor histidine kinase EnvZ